MSIMEKTVFNAVLNSKTNTQNTNKEKGLPKLSFCIMMDLAGLATYALPTLGEWGDILWAPLSGFIFLRSFGGYTGAIGGVINMVEELMPFSDFIPTFTIGYLYTRYKRKNK